MTVTIERDSDTRVRITAPPRYVDMVNQVPGTRYDHRTQTWTAPLSWGTCIASRAVFKDELVPGERIGEWSWGKHHQISRVAAAKSGAIVAPNLDQGLYPFQVLGATFLAVAERALLASEPGCGKTIQTIAALKSAAETPTQPLTVLPALIVCTNSMKWTWKSEIEKWWPGVSVAVVGGTPTQRRKAIASSADFTIVNWEALKSLSRLAPYGSIHLTDKEKEPKGLNAAGFHTVVADEAHRGKDPRSKQTRAWWHLAHEATFRFALTGTPIANEPQDLFGILHGLAPEEWPSRTAFIERYTNSGLNIWGSLETYGLKPETTAEFHALIDPLFLRHTKAEVLPDLPAKVYATRTVDMAPKQAKAYADFQKHMLAQLDSGLLVATDPLTALGRLTQIASALPVLDEAGNVTALEEPSCKVDALLDILDEAPGEPLVVFAASRKLIELAARVLERKKIPAVQITGAVPPEQRAFSVSSFQNGEPQVALCTVGAGGEGITLTRASRVAFLQRPWSLVQSKQAEDRVHRIGQDASSVEIIDVVTAGTCESAVHGTLVTKGQKLDEITRDPERLRALLQGES